MSHNNGETGLGIPFLDAHTLAIVFNYIKHKIKNHYSKEIEFFVQPVQPRGVPHRFLRFLTKSRKIFVFTVDDNIDRESYRTLN